MGHSEPTCTKRLQNISWILVLAVSIVVSIGVVILYSTANGHMQPWASKQIIRFAIALIPMIGAAIVRIRYWYRISYWLYAAVFLLIIVVDMRGFVGMGAQRWIDLGVIQLQPSELMTVALTLALARYFHRFGSEDVIGIVHLIPPSLMIILPAGLILKEPDLGTGMILLIGGAALFFLAGVRLRIFLSLSIVVAGMLPIVWRHLHDYQKDRIYTFLDPNSDPMGAGYHILQSKIALGSGGLFGKGFLLGTQSYLNFLPEKQTDFIFTTLAEEFGFIGGLALLGLYILIIGYGFVVALRSQSSFGKLVALGVITNFFLYVFINIAMVTGLIPVVGVPLPLISYGGTAMLTMMFGLGLVMSVGVDRDVRLNRAGEPQPA
ncbi:MAG: rod shape-determining protein RodA [Stellaceae bacterium]